MHGFIFGGLIYGGDLFSGFYEVKYRRSARMRFKKRTKFGYYLRFPLFCFMKGRIPDFICAS